MGAAVLIGSEAGVCSAVHRGPFNLENGVGQTPFWPLLNTFFFVPLQYVLPFAIWFSPFEMV